jgi:serine/threonine protein kinase/Flp pilus assembly protein TadD
MNAEAHKIRSLFLAAVENHPPEQWKAYLDEACASDLDLRHRVEVLLRAHADANSLLDDPGQRLVATVDESMREGPGTVIGSYKLLEQIGEGGFGVVFMAEQQQPVRRQVALKVIKPGMDSRQVIARFEAERQALALMDHPNIAQVFDGGETATGRPYFVMELVRGVPITQFCDENRLTPRRRLELFLSVCQAVQHAHQKGIIHRDVKPSNVLVSSHDGTPEVKVIDFGVAKAVGRQLSDKTVYTGFAQMIGTPLYMSPEQAGLSGLDIDTRTDLYALGVLLYELLTGTTPFEGERLRQASYDEIRRIIREEEPPKPSTRISTLGQAASTVSANRQSDPKRLSQLCRRELDWIVMKALEKDRNRRYETASAFAADVQRYLNDEPVQACPPSRWYRFRKFARRNRAKLAMAAVIVVATLALAGVAGWVLQERAGRLARTDEKAGEALDESARHQDRGATPEALEAVAKAESALAAGGGDATLRDRVARRRRDLEMVRQLEDVFLEPTLWDSGNDAEANSAQACVLFAQAFRDHGIDVEKLDVAEVTRRIRATTVAVELAAALDRWSKVATPPKGDDGNSKRLLAIAAAADPDPLRVRVREALSQRDLAALSRLAADSPAEGFPPSTAILLGWTLAWNGKDDLALEVLWRAQRRHPGHFWINQMLAHCLGTAQPPRCEETIRFASAALAVRPTGPGGYTSTQRLGDAFLNKGDLAEAVAAYRRATELRPQNGAGYFNLACALRAQGKLDEAADAFRKATQIRPDDHVAHDAIGDIRERQQRYAEAAEGYRQAIAVCPSFAPSHVHLANLQLRLGDPAGAVKACQEAIKHAPDFGRAYPTLGLAHKALGQLDQAEAALRKAIEVKHGISPRYRATMRAVGGGHFQADAYADLAAILQAQKRFDEAIDACREAIAQDKKCAKAHCQLGSVYVQQDKPAEAIKHLRDALALKEDLSGAHFDLGRALEKLKEWESAAKHYSRAAELKPYQFWTDIQLGLVREKLHRLPEAEDAYRRAVTRLRDLTQKSTRLDHRSALGAALNNLARILNDRGEPKEARDLLTEAIPHQQAALDAEPKNPDVRAFLRNHCWHLATAQVLLRDHRGAAAAAAELVRLYPDGWQEQVRAAEYLARCAALAAKDAGLTEEQRREVAREYGDRALALLRQAVDRGWRDAAALTGPSFEPLRSRDDFHALRKRTGSLSPDPLVAANVLKGTLAKDDPMDSFPLTRKSHHKVHVVPLEGGRPYLIDLQGQFDTFLRIENSQKQTLLFNDDVRPDDLNSRLVFLPPQKDTYRLVVTSFTPGATGPYTLSIQEAVKVGEPTVCRDKLQNTDNKQDGKFFKTHKLQLSGGSPYTIDLESRDFDTFLVLLDGAGKPLAGNDDIVPGNTRQSRLDFTPKADAAFTIVVTSFGRGETGAYMLTVQRYEVAKEKKPSPPEDKDK